MSDASVYERVHSVLADLPTIGKNSNAPASMGGYKFRGIEDIVAALKPLLKEHGIFMVPSVIERLENVRQTGNNKNLYVVDILVRFTFYATDGSNFTADVWGEGTDSGDKATQKAMTSAFKSMLSVTFCISDGETDSERHDVPETTSDRLASKSDLAAIGQWIASLPEEHRAAVQAEVAERFGASSELPSSQVDAVIDFIESRSKEISVSTPTETEEGSGTAAPPVRAGSATEGLKAPAAVAEPLPIPPSVRADLKRRDVLLFAAKLSPRAEAKRLNLPAIENCDEHQLNEWAHLIEAKEIELAELRAPFNERAERVS